MSRVFGPIQQIGYVVKNLDEAIQHWVTVLGVGPFYKASHVPIEYYRYHGKECAPDISFAFAYYDDIQIELIEQHNDAPSSYLEFMQTRGPGPQHFSTCTYEYDILRARLEKLGFKINSEGCLLGGRFTYYETTPGTVIEVAEMFPGSESFFDELKRSSIDWDGSDPVRTFPL